MSNKEKTISIRQKQFVNGDVIIPGSKSYTNRAIAIAALAEGQTVIKHALLSDDTLLLADAIKAFGAKVDIDREHSTITVERASKPLLSPAQPVFMGNAGTPIRLLMSVASLSDGVAFITGNERMQERPCQDLLDALTQLGVDAENVNNTGCPPVRISGPSLKGGRAKIRGSVSSQFTSSVLISAPYAEQDVELEVYDDLTSKPYVDMTIHIMEQFGVKVERDGYKSFLVKAGQRYKAQTYQVEPDASNMSYFLAAAALTKGRVSIPGISMSSKQGDAQFINVLEQMGCCVERGETYLAVSGKSLKGIEVDMNKMPDLVPTLAILAAYADGKTHIVNIENLRIKECDRIAAMETELRKMGITAYSTESTLTIEGGTPHGAIIDTYDDHRIAMSFAVAGLITPNVLIRDPDCVNKSFPSFWDVFNGLKG